MENISIETAKSQTYSKPVIAEIGDAAALTLGNTGGPSIDPGVPPIATVQWIYNV